MADDTIKMGVDFSEIDKAVAAGINAFAAMSVGVIEKLNDVNDYVINTLHTGVVASFGGMKTAAIKAFSAIGAGASPVWATIAGGASKLPGLISGAFGAILSPIKTVFSAIASTVQGVFSGIYSTIKSVFSGITGFISGTISKISETVKSLLPLVGIGLFAGLTFGFREVLRGNESIVKLNASLQITGNAAGFSAGQLKKMADSLSETTRFGKTAALGAVEVMTQFRNVRGDVFAQGMKLAADAAVKGGKDISAGAEEIGRALNDPIEGLKLLRDWGQFVSIQQEQLLQSMMDSGRGMEAQAVVLRKLQAALHDVAEKDAKTFSGAIARANNAMLQMWQTISGSLAPVVQDVADWFKKGADQIATWGPALDKAVAAFRTWSSETSRIVKDWFDQNKEKFINLGGIIGGAMVAAAAFVKTAFGELGVTFEFVKSQGMLAFDALKNSVFDVFGEIVKRGKSAWNEMLDALDVRFGESMDRMIFSAQKAAANLRQSIPFANLGVGRDAPLTDAEVERRVQEGQRGRRLEAQRRKNMERFAEEGVQINPIGQDQAAQAAAQKRLEETQKLKEAADAAAEAFKKVFNPNKKGFEEAVENMKQALRDAFKDDAKPGSPRIPRPNDAPFQDRKVAGVGQFEGLLDLQRRISSASAGRPPEITAAIETGKSTTKMAALMEREKARQERLEKQAEKQTVALENIDKSMINLHGFAVAAD